MLAIGAPDAEGRGGAVSDAEGRGEAAPGGPAGAAAPFTVPPERLASLPVRDADGRRIGRIQDVYLTDSDGSLVAVTVAVGRMATRVILVPADLLELRGGEVHVGVGGEALRGGVPAPVTGHAGAEQIAAARRALGEG